MQSGYLPAAHSNFFKVSFANGEASQFPIVNDARAGYPILLARALMILCLKRTTSSNFGRKSALPFFQAFGSALHRPIYIASPGAILFVRVLKFSAWRMNAGIPDKSFRRLFFGI